MIKESLSKPHKFTDFVNFKYVVDRKGERLTLRTTGKKLPKGIYQLYLPSFGIFYVGISYTDNSNGIVNRFLAHAQKLTGAFKGAKDTREFKRFRNLLEASGNDLRTILSHVSVYFIPCPKMKTKEIEAWETIIFNSLKNKGQAICNSAKKVELMDKETIDYILNQKYLND
jgi:hypothetical protein